MLKISLILCLAIYVVCVKAIINGVVVDIAKHPYLVSIRFRSENNGPYVHMYAGNIYSERVVITVAQCIHDIKDNTRVMVVAGANTRNGTDGMPYPVTKWAAHANYSAITVDYDIGILILDTKFDFGYYAIESISVGNKRPAAGRLGTVAGWGYTEEYGPSSYNLEEVQVPIVSKAACAAVYGDINERMICAGYMSGGKDACQGDGGAPLVIDNKLVGLVSWGRGCARPNYPSVYTFVSSLQKWIDDTIAENVEDL